MVEVFCGCGSLCVTAKLSGLQGSIAVDKVKKKAIACALFQLDLLHNADRAVLEKWMN